MSLEINQVHQGDCLALMPNIPDKSVDMILCDLPYGTSYCEWDSIIDMGKLWAEYERVIKDNGAIVLTASSHFTFKLWQSNEKIFRYKLVWDKRLKLGLFDATKRPMRQHEDILVFYKKSPCYNPQKTISNKSYSLKAGKKLHCDFQKNPIFTQEKKDVVTRYPCDIIQIDSTKLTREGGLHPTQKPVALFEYLIKTYTNEGDLVLDNCAGSGTTAIACINANRRYICIEQNEEYVRRSRERIANHEPLLQLIQP
jgi:site-specific DNA-methyltransferase (adenine-specific)